MFWIQYSYTKLNQVVSNKPVHYPIIVYSTRPKTWISWRRKLMLETLYTFSGKIFPILCSYLRIKSFLSISYVPTYIVYVVNMFVDTYIIQNLRLIVRQKSEIALNSVSRPNTVLLKIQHRKLHCLRALIRQLKQNVFALNRI